MRAVKLAENPMEMAPGPIQRLLSRKDGYTFGFGYGPGWSLIFGSEQGDIAVQPGQWVVRHDDGTITVQDEVPTHHAGHPLTCGCWESRPNCGCYLWDRDCPDYAPIEEDHGHGT